MTTTPDPKAVREIAQTAGLLIVETVARDHIVHKAMAQHGIGRDNVYAWSETYDRVLDELATVLKPLTRPAEQPQDERDASLPGLLCRATAMHEEGVRHYCTLNTAAHAVHQCGDCGHVWTDSGEEFETVLAERNQLRLQAAAQDERDGDVRAVAALIETADSHYRELAVALAVDDLRARFADRIAELDARDAEAGEQQ